jgi:hypothetical protein
MYFLVSVAVIQLDLLAIILTRISRFDNFIHNGIFWAKLNKIFWAKLLFDQKILKKKLPFF